jgi:hypothetical protein
LHIEFIFGTSGGINYKIFSFFGGIGMFNRRFLAVLAIISFAALAYMPSAIAQHGISGRYSNCFVTHEYEEVSSTTGLVGVIEPLKINTSGLQKTQRAYITFTGQGIRFTCDGTTPSTNLGIPVGAGGSIEVIGIDDIQNFKFINDDDAGSAVAHISLQYEKELN